MEFASPFPWWTTVLLVVAIAAVAFTAYRRPLAPLTARQRIALTALRAVALALIVLILARPVRLRPPLASGALVVPVLVDASRSMRIADADGQTRSARAAEVVSRELLPALGPQIRTEVLRLGDTIQPAGIESVGADGRASDLSRAIESVKDRYRGLRVPGVVLVSDGGETRAPADGNDPRGGATPVFTIGVGSPDGPKDREILDVTAGDPKLDQASVDLHVSAVAHGFGREPFTVKVLENGQLVDSREVTPSSDGAPVEELFTVLPDPLQANVFTAQISGSDADSIPENDSRSLLVSPAGRKRRLLVMAGAPGYEHSFLLRTLVQDPGFDVDSIVRKGKNEQGVDTFLVQAAGGRAQALTNGFPSSREALFVYDAVAIANIEGEFFTRAQLDLLARFVSERGGGFLLLGGRSFEQRSLIGTPVEEVLPLELNDRRGGALRLAGEDLSGPHDTIVLTREGERNPVMRLGPNLDDTRKLWSSLPPLASNALVGGPRPGASVLAVTNGPSGAVPVVAVQRYGRGRSMIFAGEASWRWRMMLPAADRRYETFWRQSLRWLSADAPDPVTITAPAEAAVGAPLPIVVEVRDRAYLPISGATATATMAPAGGAPVTFPLRPSGTGRFVGSVSPDAAGVYRLHVQSSGGAETTGDADRWVYVGGTDREFAEPRLNEAVLRRLARDSGGRYVPASDAAAIAEAIKAMVPKNLEPIREDLWNRPWMFALVLIVLAAEWALRRAWGLR